jgi:hypothetical protein
MRTRGVPVPRVTPTVPARRLHASYTTGIPCV